MQFNFEQELQKLNDQQREAVETIFGPVIMIAGPGAGKTHVLSMRIANIINSTDTNPSNITALTFTDAAAGNMRNRLKKMIGKAAQKVNITTFHGFCNDLIQSNKDIFQFSKELVQLDELTRIKILQEILDELELNELKKFNLPYLYLRDIAREISNIKRAGLTPDNFLELVEIEKKDLGEPDISKRTGKPSTKWKKQEKLINKNLELARIYKEFQARLTSEGLYDFDDMLIFVNQELQQNPDFLAEIREKFQFFLVDEYQDTNGAQNKLLITINSFDDLPNLFVVGDDDQAIYSFQGANLQNLLDFKKKYPSAKVVTTKYNYRSVQEILDQSTNLIENNQERFTNIYPEYDKKLISGNNSLNQIDNPVKIVKFDTNFSETDWITKQIKNLINQGVNPSEIAVIYRNHKDSEGIINGLIMNNIDFQTDSNNNVLTLPIIRNFLTALTVIANPLDTNNYVKYIQNFVDISQISKLKLFHYIGNKTNLSLTEILENDAEFNKINIESELDKSKLKKVNSEILEQNKNLTGYPASVIIAKTLDKLNLISKDVNADQINNSNAFFSLWQYAKVRSKTNSSSTEIYSLIDFLKDIKDIENNNLSINYVSITNYKKGVNLITAHRSKGLEFKYVFITKLVKGNWDNKRATNKLKLIPLTADQSELNSIEEERRLLFVAITRAKLQVFLTYSEKYYLDDQNIQEKDSSEFLIELNNIETESISKKDTNLQNNIMLKDSINAESNTDLMNDKDIKNFLKNRLINFRLSASALRDYQECSLRFLFNHILRVPKIDSPYLILGSALHKSLEYAYKSIQSDPNIPSKNNIAKVGLTYIQNQDLSIMEKEQIIAEFNQVFIDYYDHVLSNQLIPEKIMGVEKSFGKNLFFENIPLSGKIDLIEWEGSDKRAVKIIDFKSGKPQSKNTILGETKNQDYIHYYQQLLFYVIMLESDQFYTQSVKSAELRFLRPRANSHKYVTHNFEIDDKKLTELKEEIRQTYESIQNLEFSQKCNQEDCNICNFIQ